MHACICIVYALAFEDAILNSLHVKTISSRFYALMRSSNRPYISLFESRTKFFKFLSRVKKPNNVFVWMSVFCLSELFAGDESRYT